MSFCCYGAIPMEANHLKFTKETERKEEKEEKKEGRSYTNLSDFLK